MAPKYKYPTGLHDCFCAFEWIKKFVEKVIGTQIKKYILFGDSSWGNYVMGLSYWIIESNLKLPIFISLAYPCLRIRYMDFTPSMLVCLHDLLLSYGGIGLIGSLYMENPKLRFHDPYLTSILMDNSILERLPPVGIYVGKSDPLYDDSLRFTQKLTDLKK